MVPNWQREFETVCGFYIGIGVEMLISVDAHRRRWRCRFTIFQQWGYFEVGMFHGTPAEQEVALHDFELGRLDVGKSLRVILIPTALQ